jgi:acyl-CoA oxidase
MSDLFALRCIENDTLFRNEELVAPAKAKAIQKLVLTLCSELRGVAVPLVNAFGVPDHILRAPIGLGATAGVDMYKEYLHAVGFDV